MWKLILAIGFLLVSLVPAPAWAQATLSPSNPAVTQGGTVTITASGSVGTGSVWTCPGCAGTLSNATATTVQYTAPATITPQQMIAGWPLLPNDDIENWNISSLPVHTNSAHWMFDGAYWSAGGPPNAPSLSCSNSGGSLATGTYFVKFAYWWNFGGGAPNGNSGSSPEASCALTGPNGSVTVTAPTIYTIFSGYSVYSSTTTGTEKRQDASNACVNISTNCVIQVVGAGASAPSFGTFGNMGIMALFPGTAGINYLSAFPTNYTNGSTPTVQNNFVYTPANNGLFEEPTLPGWYAESGILGSLVGYINVDHHNTTANMTSGGISERYQRYCGNFATTGADVGITGGTNVATLKFGSDPFQCGLRSGQSAFVGNFSGGDTFFNGTFSGITVNPAPTNSITFALTHANATAATNGVVSTASCPTCTSQSGIKYSAFAYPLPNGSTDAAGLQLEPLILRLQEFEQAIATGGTINHALRFTSNNVFNCTCFVWPASSNANVGNFLPYGARFRLKPASTFPISGFSSTAQILMKQLEQQGLIMADGGTQFQINVEQAPFSKPMNDAFNVVNGATQSFSVTNTALANNICTVTAPGHNLQAGYAVNVTGTANGTGACNLNNAKVLTASGSTFSYFVCGTNFGSCGTSFGSAADSGSVAAFLTNYLDVIDESGLEESALSGAVRTGEAVTYTSSTGTAIDNIALQGPAVNSTQDEIYVLAGPGWPAITLPFVATNTNLNCTMSPSVGTLVSSGASCLYTPPASQGSPTSITVTAAATANANVASPMTIWIFPSTGSYITQIVGGGTYTDVGRGGNTWVSAPGGIGLGINNLPHIPGSSNNNAGYPNITDKQLWWTTNQSSLSQGDIHSIYYVPPGCYQVTYFGGETSAAAQTFYLQGQKVLYQGNIGNPYMWTGFAQPDSNHRIELAIMSDTESSPSNSAALSSISVVPGCPSPSRAVHFP